MVGVRSSPRPLRESSANAQRTTREQVGASRQLVSDLRAEPVAYRIDA